jgi:hypothetical protein
LIADAIAESQEEYPTLQHDLSPCQRSRNSPPIGVFVGCDISGRPRANFLNSEVDSVEVRAWGAQTRPAVRVAEARLRWPSVAAALGSAWLVARRTVIRAGERGVSLCPAWRA